MIYYVVINEEISRKIKRFKIGDRVESHHLLLAMVLKGRKRRKQKKEIQEYEKEEEEIKVIM